MGIVEKMNSDKRIPINIQELKNDKMMNFRDRIQFIKYWANYIKTHPDKEWSKGQTILIDSQFKSARDFYKNLKKTEEGRKILLRLRKKLIAN